MTAMKPTPTVTAHRRLTLLPVESRTDAGRPQVRRYRLGRVVDDIGLALAASTQAPVRGQRAP
jgi:hypothetical protein